MKTCTLRRLLVLAGALFFAGGLCLLQSAWPQSILAPILADGPQHGGSSYTGIGDIYTSGIAFYSCTRAYNSAGRGAALCNVCDSTGGVDVACADISSSATTGLAVPATIGGITCPGNTNCTVKTAYDLTGGGIDVTMATVATRPTLPAANTANSLTCMSFSGTQYLKFTAGTGITQSQPFTVSATITLHDSSAIRAIIDADNGATFAGDLYFNANTVPRLYSGTDFSTSSLSLDTFTALQGLANGASSNVNINGTDYTGNSGINAIANTYNIYIGNDGGSEPYNGIICEAGYFGGDQSASFSSVSSNQHTAYGF